MSIFLGNAKDEDPALFRLVMGALNTGARLGELVGLQWDKVDLDKRLIHIARKWDPKVKKLQNVTKGRKSRTVGINDALYLLLAEMKLRGHEPWVFSEEEGARIEGDQLTNHRFRPACDRAGVPSIRFHDLRHTYAVHFMQAGGDIYQLQQILGHKTIETTQQYLRFSPQFTEQLHQAASTISFGASQGEAKQKVIPLEQPIQRREIGSL